VKLQVSIVFDGNLDLFDREAFLLVFAVESSWLLLPNFVLNALRVEAPLRQCVALAETLIAFPTSFEVEIFISGEVTLWDILPVVAFFLFISALIVIILWRIEAASMSVPSSSNLLSSEPRQEESD
jgi:hypothetical protein